MPVMDGYQRASQLRQRGVTTPIIALTANAMQRDLDRSLEAGCNAYLRKPVDVDALLDLTAEYLSANRERQKPDWRQWDEDFSDKGAAQTLHPKPPVPVSRMPDPSPPPPESTPPSQGRAVKVLVVDDSRAVLDTMKTLLELDGHQVQTAERGRRALETAADFLPDVALIDLSLPDISGHDVARRLRDDSVAGNALLVAVSGHGEPKDRQRAEEAGFDHFLVKPVDFNAMNDIIQRCRPQKT
jgi:CheY-like chemotaxis protein